MKTYNVITTVHTNKEMYVGDTIKLNEKELEKIAETVNTRQIIRLSITNEKQIIQKFFPINNIQMIEVRAKEIEEN